MQDLLTHIATGIEVFFVGYVAIAFVTGYRDRGSSPLPPDQRQPVEELEQVLIASDPFEQVIDILGEPGADNLPDAEVEPCDQTPVDDVDLIRWAKAQKLEFSKKWSYKRKLRPSDRARILEAMSAA